MARALKNVSFAKCLCKKKKISLSDILAKETKTGRPAKKKGTGIWQSCLCDDPGLNHLPPHCEVDKVCIVIRASVLSQGLSEAETEAGEPSDSCTGGMRGTEELFKC